MPGVHSNWKCLPAFGTQAADARARELTTTGALRMKDDDGADDDDM